MLLNVKYHIIFENELHFSLVNGQQNLKKG